MDGVVNGVGKAWAKRAVQLPCAPEDRFIKVFPVVYYELPGGELLMRAVWNAVSFEPSANLVARTEARIARSHELNIDDLESRLCC